VGTIRSKRILNFGWLAHTLHVTLIPLLSWMFFSVWHWNDFFHHYRKQYVTIIKRLNRIVDGHWYQQRVERELFTHGPGNDGMLTCTTLNWSERQEPWKCVLIAGMPDDPACKNARFINILISLGRMWHWPPAKECNLQKGNVPHCFYTSSWSCISRKVTGLSPTVLFSSLHRAEKRHRVHIFSACNGYFLIIL
jgi:hypothetical protein